MPTSPRTSRRWTVTPLLCRALLAAACDDGEDLVPPLPTVTGVVTNSATGAPLDGVEVRIGTLADTTGADGRFELNDVTPGAATIQCTATGFEPAETDATVSSTGLAIDFIFSRTELFEYSVFALYVPATVTVRGILLTLGGLTPGRS